jgi:hypothetical protein
MSKLASAALPVVSVVLRSSALIAVAVLLIMVLLPAALGAVGPQVPIGR